MAFAATGTHELLRAEDVDLSEEFLFWAAKQRNGLGQVEGTTLAAAAQALNDLGQPPETTWPYDDLRDHRSPTYDPPPNACAIALARQMPLGTPGLPTPATLKAALQAGQAVVLGFELYDTWFSVPGDGRIAMPSPSAVMLGGHAVLLAGFEDGSPGQDSFFLVRNSWGAGWGLEGYACLPFA